MDIENALQLLVDGNNSFRSEKLIQHDVSPQKRASLADGGQSPYALIVVFPSIDSL